MNLLILFLSFFCFTSCTSVDLSGRSRELENNSKLKIKTEFSECSPIYENKIRLLFNSSIEKGAKCLMRFGSDRETDALALLKLVSEKTVNLSCDLAAKYKSVAMANFQTFPGISIRTESLDALDTTEIEAMLFHESLHWLNYKHSSGIDVPYLAEICCFESSGIAKSKSRKIACPMLTMKPEEWLTPEYNQKFTEVLSNYGRGHVALETAWHAALEASKNDTSFEQSFKIIFASIKSDSRGHFELNSDRKFDAGFKKTKAPTHGIIFGKVVELSSDEDLRRDAQAYISGLQIRFFSEDKDYDKKKIEFLSLIGQSIGGVLTGKSASVSDSWNKASSLAKDVCSKLTSAELDGVKHSLSMTHLESFSLKPKLPTKVLLGWSKICDDLP